MAATGARKAAALLLSLDPGSAAQLLQSAAPEAVKQIAAELTLLAQAGAKGQPETVREFVTLLREGPSNRDPVRKLLEMALGEQGAPKVLKEAAELVAARDPFAQIRAAAVNEISEALAGESAQVVALVLAELPAKKSIQLLPLLEESIRTEAVRQMTGGQEVASSVRLKVATALRLRMQENARKAAAAAGGAEASSSAGADEIRPEQRQHRKVAVVLRGLPKEVRDGLLEALTKKDPAVVEGIKKMTVLWQDLPAINDRAMQEGLRSVDSRKLALALVGADPAAGTKVRKNISERASAMLDEETSLLNSPKPADIAASREQILAALRQINDRGDMTFEDS